MSGNPDTFDYQIGLSSGSMVKLDAITVSGSAVPVSWPKFAYSPYAEEQNLTSGLVRGVGYPTASWTWDIITRAERDALRQYCTGKSARVYIKTKTMDSSDSYHVYYAVMIWPTGGDEEHDFQRRPKLIIRFKTMVLVS